MHGSPLHENKNRIGQLHTKSQWAVNHTFVQLGMTPGSYVADCTFFSTLLLGFSPDEKPLALFRPISFFGSGNFY